MLSWSQPFHLVGQKQNEVVVVFPSVSRDEELSSLSLMGLNAEGIAFLIRKA